jgi:hypothetical protein
MKEQLTASTLPKKNWFLDSGAQEENVSKCIYMFIKIDRIIRFLSTFFYKFNIDDGQQNMVTFDLSATYVSWNPGQKLQKSSFLTQAIPDYQTKYVVFLLINT